MKIEKIGPNLYQLYYNNVFIGDVFNDEFYPHISVYTIEQLSYIKEVMENGLSQN